MFPRDDVRLSEWLVNIQREGFEPHVASRLCSEHFTGDCFDRSGLRVMLSKNAVPTIFTEVIPRVIFGWSEGPSPKDCICHSLPPSLCLSLPEADILNFNAMTLKFGT